MTSSTHQKFNHTPSLAKNPTQEKPSQTLVMSCSLRPILWRRPYSLSSGSCFQSSRCQELNPPLSSRKSTRRHPPGFNLALLVPDVLHMRPSTLIDGPQFSPLHSSSIGLGVRKIQRLIVDRDPNPDLRPSGLRLIHILERPTSIVFRVTESVQPSRDEYEDSFGVYNPAAGVGR